MRISSFVVPSRIVRGFAVVAVSAVAALMTGCGVTNVATVGGLFEDPSAPAGQAKTSVTGVSLNPLTWGKDKEHEASVEAAKADTTDPIGKAMVLQNKDMYFGPKYGNTWFSAGEYLKRQKLVNERAETKLTEREELDQQIKALSGKIVAQEQAGFNKRLTELQNAKSSDPNVTAQINAHIAWVNGRLADLKSVQADSISDNFAVVVSKEGTTSSMAAK